MNGRQGLISLDAPSTIDNLTQLKGEIQHIECTYPPVDKEKVCCCYALLSSIFWIQKFDSERNE